MEMKTTTITAIAVLLFALILAIIAGSIVVPIIELQQSVGEQIAEEQLVDENN